MELSYELTSQLAKLAARKFLWGSSRGAILLSLVLIFACTVGFLIGYSHWLLTVICTVFSLFLVGCWRGVTNADRFLKKFTHLMVTLRFNEETLELQTSDSQVLVNWNKVNQLYKFSEVWLILHSVGHNYYLVPTEHLTNELAEFIERKLAESGGEVVSGP